MRSPCPSLLSSRLNPSLRLCRDTFTSLARQSHRFPRTFSRRERPRLSGGAARPPRSSVRPSVPVSAPSGAAVTRRAPIGRFKSRGLLERRGRLQARPSPPRPRRSGPAAAVPPLPLARAMLTEQENQENVPPPPAAGKAAAAALGGTRVALGLLRGAQQRAGIPPQVRGERRGKGGTGKGQRRPGEAGAVRADGRSPHTGGAGRLRGPWSGGRAAAASTSALLHPPGRARWGAGAAAAAGRPGGAEGGGGGAGAAGSRVRPGGAAAPGPPGQRHGAELR